MRSFWLHRQLDRSGIVAEMEILCSLARYYMFAFTCSVLFLGGIFTVVAEKGPSFSFSFERFEKGPALDEVLGLFGDAVVSESSVRMVPTSSSTSGSVVYRKSINFGRKPSFSTEFAFSISAQKGNGLAFFVAPGNVPKESLSEQLFGLSPGVFAVEFDTSMDSDSRDPNGNHVGVDVGSSVSLKTFNVSAVNLVLNSGEKLQSWVDFDGGTKVLEVRLNRSGGARPSVPFISYLVDLSGVIWQDDMFVGISSSSGGNSTQTATIYSWSFRLKHAAPYLMHSEPLDPGPFIKPQEEESIANHRRDYLPNILMALVLGAACGAAVAFLMVFLWSAKGDRHPIVPVEYPPLSIGYEKIIVVGEKGMGAVVVGEKGTDAGTKPGV